MNPPERLRAILIWTALAAAIAVPIIAAAFSPLLAWRRPIYIAGGFAGIIAMTLLLVQPLLATGYLPGLPRPRARRLHLWVGAALVLAVAIHVAALWITSPPDVIDVLLLRSPTPFAIWGVVAMWAVFATLGLALLRRRLRLRPRTWGWAHTVLILVFVPGSVIHALLIEGSMESLSKIALCILVVVASTAALRQLRR